MGKIIEDEDFEIITREIDECEEALKKNRQDKFWIDLVGYWKMLFINQRYGELKSSVDNWDHWMNQNFRANTDVYKMHAILKRILA